MLDLLLFSLFILLVGLTVPIGYALGIAAAIWIILDGTTPFILIPQRMYAGIDSFPLIAIPFFILAGKIMATGGISDRLIRFASVLVGMLKG